MNKILALTLVSAGVALAVALLRAPGSGQGAAPVAAVPPAPRPDMPRPPDLPALMARLGNGGAPPTPEQLAEQKRMVDGQVADAVALLDSGDAAQKVEAAEQLAAYPTPAAERRLARALAEEKAPDVRAAAARALAQVANPEPASVAALLGAVPAPGDEPQAAALQTLATYLNRLDPGSARFRDIRSGLGKLAQSKRLSAEHRQAVRELLAHVPG